MKIQALVVAAGMSTRADGYKMLYKFGDKTMIERVVENLIPFCQKVFVVTGHNGYKIKKVLKDYKNVKIIKNNTYKKGMFNSIQTGVKHINADKFFFTPGDYPNIKKETLRKLLEPEGEIVIPSYKYSAGHPILIDGKLSKEISKYSENKTLRDFIKKKDINYVEVDDPGIIQDVDTDEKYKEVLRCMGYEN